MYFRYITFFTKDHVFIVISNEVLKLKCAKMQNVNII